nr:MAG TPA: hypothetical protein [Caudoviricetes sp.]
MIDFSKIICYYIYDKQRTADCNCFLIDVSVKITLIVTNIKGDIL